MSAEDSLVAPIEGISSSVLDEFRTGFRTHAVMAMKRQEALNAASARLENASRLMDGIGQLKYRIDQDLYWHLQLQPFFDLGIIYLTTRHVETTRFPMASPLLACFPVAV